MYVRGNSPQPVITNYLNRLKTTRSIMWQGTDTSDLIYFHRSRYQHLSTKPIWNLKSYSLKYHKLSFHSRFKYAIFQQTEWGYCMFWFRNISTRLNAWPWKYDKDNLKLICTQHNVDVCKKPIRFFFGIVF